MLDLRTIAKLLGGELVAGQQVLCPGPGHSARDRSLSVTFDPSAPDGFVCYDHANPSAWQAGRDHVRQRLGLSASTAFTPPPTVPPAKTNKRKALTIWNASVDPAGTLVEVYLASRNVLEAARPAFNRTLRFHPSCRFGGYQVSCLTAIIRDINTDEPKAIHRTALSPDGRKIEVGGRDRMALGPIAGGAVKLTDDADVTLALGIGEGIETTLSLALLPQFGTTARWALLNEAGVASFPVLSSIECLWIAVDHDPAGQRAAQQCSERWLAAGKETVEVFPNQIGADVNDVVRRRHG